MKNREELFNKLKQDIYRNNVDTELRQNILAYLKNPDQEELEERTQELREAVHRIFVLLPDLGEDESYTKSQQKINDWAYAKQEEYGDRIGNKNFKENVS